MAKEEEIKKWQESLFEAFAYNDVLGGRYLSPAMGIEKVVGSVFVDKYRGHRVLTDAFMDFLGATIWAQAEYNNANGWPQKSPYYVTCLLMYLTMFRSFRAAELLSLHGYPLQGYVLQRSLKDQAYCLCAAANGMATFGELFGWEDIGEITEERYATVIKNRRKIEEQTRDQLVGSKSGLSAEAQHELLQWERLFNFEAHRGLFTLFRAVRRVLVQKKLEMVLGPTPDEMNESMYLNRCTETAWMIHRLVPFMRRPETPKEEGWDRKWKLLDDSFAMMVDGLAELGKRIAPAFKEMVGAKFAFGPETYYAETKTERECDRP